MELRHLRYFAAVAEHLHFGRAAAALHISQPPLTRQIKQLEQELGVRLFARNNRNVELTAAGKLALQHATALLAQADELGQRTREVARGGSGELAIGFISVADYNVLPPLLKQFRARYPGVQLRLREATSDIQLEALRGGKLDLGIVLGPVDDAQLNFRATFREPLVAALPAAHGAHCAPLPVSTLRNEPFILFPRPLAPGLYDDIIGVCKRAGFSPEIGQEAIQMQTIVSLVSAGMGVALVPASLMHLRRTGVIYRALRDRSPTVTTGLAWKRDTDSTLVDNFLAVAATLKISRSPRRPVRNAGGRGRATV
jgi:DNA-binding transcriptional LysR family regulator